MVNQARSRELSRCQGREGLPAWTALRPIQMQDDIAGVPQPSRHFFHLERRAPGSRSRLSTSVISSAVLGFLILFKARLMYSSRRFAFEVWPICGPRVGSLSVAKVRFNVGVVATQRTPVIRNLRVSTEESICKSPQAHALRQNRPTYTIAQSSSVLPRASPNSRSPAIRQLTLATRLVGRQTRVRCAQ